MRAYLCSIGEKTTGICKEQLERFGFEVILLDKQESWYNKYKRFIFQADNEECIRIDADIIPNKNITYFQNYIGIIAQAQTYDFYKNDIGITSPVYYSKQAIQIIRENWHLIGKDRPETDASRIPELNFYLYTSNLIMGLHGFFQTREDLNRHIKHKEARKQMEYYDFKLAERLIELK